MSRPLPDGTHLAYVVCDRRHWAWLMPGIEPPGIRVMLSVPEDEDYFDRLEDDLWAFFVVEYELPGYDRPGLRLEMGGWAWPAFAQIPEFFAALGAGQFDSHQLVGDEADPRRRRRPSPGRRLKEVVALLESVGAVNETERWAERS